MRTVLLLLSIFMVINNSHCQNLEGRWRWINKAEDRSFEIDLAKPREGDSVYDFVGEHCGSYYNGGRVDCTEEISIYLKKEEVNIFTGKIKSSYSDEISEIRLVYLPEKKQINWQVIKGQGQFYFPYDCLLEKSTVTPEPIRETIAEIKKNIKLKATATASSIPA